MKLKTLYKFFVFLSFSALTFLSACSQDQSKPVISESELETLLDRVQYLEDNNEIQKLQSKYVHLLFTQRFDRIVEETFAKNLPDVSVEFSDSGVYRGLESITALYNAFGRTTALPGFFIIHMTVNPYIEIAEDGLSAESHWLSPGASNNGSGSSWIWGPYYIDYVKEDGNWRIAHSNLVPLFRNPYEYSWGEAPAHGTVRGPLGLEPDEPTTLYRPFNEVKLETNIFSEHPDLPEAQ